MSTATAPLATTTEALGAPLERSQTRLTARQNASALSRTQSEQTRQVEESEHARIERMSRTRPPQFANFFSELAFCYSIIMSQLMTEYFVSGFNVLVPTLMRTLSIPSASAVWPAAAFALVTASFLLPFGRLADMYGGRIVYLSGLIWFFVWSIIAGFSKNELMLDWCRAMQGLGPAAFLPSGIMLIGSIYRPGPRKNLVFSVYGGSAELGFFVGVLIAGLVGSFLPFGYYFWIGAILVLTTIVAAIFAIPKDRPSRPTVKMDWLGASLAVPGLILTVFALTDGSHAPNKWATWYIPTTLVVGLALLSLAIYVEGYVAMYPLVPPSLFRVAYIKPLFLALFFNYGVLGVFLLYGVRFMNDVLGATPVQIAAWFVPMCVGGIVLAIVGGYVFHLISGTILIWVSSAGWLLTSTLFAVAPATASYWAYVFPAMLGATVGVDVAFNVTNIFISTSLPSRQQGLAGAAINTLLYLGIAFLLSLADVIQTETEEHKSLESSYRYVFWFMLACSTLSLAIMILFVRIEKAHSDLTLDEREALMNRDDTQLTELQERREA
ncbi:MAG: hypothetical protein M1831_005432 [Alyxoria varia]|nr:MAG: hypothetical protein M1831_005432 [Alyxoria varia]